MRTVVAVDHSLPVEHPRGDHTTTGVDTAVCYEVMAAARVALVALGGDALGLVAYDEHARWSTIDAASAQPWDFRYGTNLGDALALARASEQLPERVLVLAHSPPSAHRQPSGDVFFSLPAAVATTEATAAEIDRCTAAGIRVDVIVVPPGGDPLAWPSLLVEAIGRSGGTFHQATSTADLANVLGRRTGRELRRRRLSVVVSGPPGSGTSAVAPALAVELGLPLLTKDDLEDALLATTDVPDVASSRRLGAAAVQITFELASRSPTGAVIESTLVRSVAIDDIGRLGGTVVEVCCRCPREVARARSRARAGSRGAGHVDHERTDDEIGTDEIGNDEVAEPVAGGWPVIELDTTRPVDVPALAAAVEDLASS